MWDWLKTIALYDGAKVAEAREAQRRSETLAVQAVEKALEPPYPEPQKSPPAAPAVAPQTAIKGLKLRT